MVKEQMPTRFFYRLSKANLSDSSHDSDDVDTPSDDFSEQGNDVE